MISLDRNLFPLGIAVGAAHCNRETERRRLAENIRSGRHTWLSARRRMGKTSLIEQVVLDLERRRRTVASVALDLLVVHDAEALEGRLREAVADATAALLPKSRRVLDRVTKAFGSLKPSLSIGDDGFRLMLGAGETPIQTIEAALTGLDQIAEHRKRRVMFVFDEFQQIAGLKDSAPIEAAIRHAAERAKHVTFVFAGSERHLLAQMFEDPDRPLYRVCERMTLKRISKEDYASFLTNAAKTRWKRALAPEAIGRILAVTSRHPYYVNALCGNLWRERRPPSVQSVDRTWQRYVDEDKRRVAARVLELSPAQRAMLAALARQPTPHPTAQRFLSGLRMPTSTGLQAKSVLERDDLIEQNPDGLWEVVDPVMGEYLRQI